MPVTNWGLLQKSQVDSETIEEAIARLVAVHEADEEAHLGVGESLESHKASEVIDHAALSIVADKMSNGEHFIRSNFSEAGGYDNLPAGLSVKPYWCTFSISAIDTEKELETSIAPFTPAYITGKNLMFQVALATSLGSNRYLKIHLYEVASGSYDEYVGIEFRGFELWAVASGTEDDQEVKLATLSQITTHALRFYCDSDDEKIYFYYNNVLVGELNMPTFASNYSLHVRYTLSTVDPANYALCTLRNLLISSDI